jgi:hypothetical protein
MSTRWRIGLTAVLVFAAIGCSDTGIGGVSKDRPGITIGQETSQLPPAGSGEVG